MGPRAFARGDTDLLGNAEPHQHASMGPRAFARGDESDAILLFGEVGASMGPRAFARGDAFASAKGLCASEVLQWGRELSPAEIMHGDKYVDGRELAASMGPRAFARGDRADHAVGSDPTASFNGAASFRPRRSGLWWV